MRPLKRMKKITLYIALVLLANLSMLQGQTRELPQLKQLGKNRDFRLPTRKSILDKDKLDLFKQKERRLPFDLEAQALEGAIDPAAYIVGPGDLFFITIWSTLENSIPAQVSPEGTLIMPTIGALPVDGKTLAEVQKLVEQEARGKYINSTISVSLARVRQIRVHVTGQVINPGPYQALAVHRVTDIIEQAGGLTSWAFERGIELRHLDGTTEVIDLYLYQKLGHLNANLLLRGGDVIHVPAINLTQATVRVEGTVNDPGTYQLAQGETIKDFLLRVDALTRRADIRNVFVERKSNSNGQVEVIPVFPYLNGQGNGHADLVLHDGDVIKVPQRTEDVYVIGAVQQPGTYPYIPGLTVQDYVGLPAACISQPVPIKPGSSDTTAEKKKRGKT